jgi:hypothetical protein
LEAGDRISRRARSARPTSARGAPPGITGPRALGLSTVGDEAAARSLESMLRDKLRRENARIQLEPPGRNTVHC